MKDPRYIIVKLTDENGSLYAVLDRTKIYSRERTAITERDRLNEVDDSINRAFEIAKQDRKEQK